MDTAITEPLHLQELIEEGQQEGEEYGHDPVTEGHDREGGVILVGDNGGDFWNGRVFFFFQIDRRALDIEFLIDELLFSKVLLLMFSDHGDGWWFLL